MAQPADANSTIYALNPQVLSHIFSYLDFKDCAAVACVQHTWRSLADDDQLWRRLCKEDYHVTTLEALSGSQSLSFKGVYKSWYLGFGKSRYGAFLPRAKKCWDSIIEWMQRHAPDIAATIAPGASEGELDQLEKVIHFWLTLFPFHWS
jgi:cell wall assembly regulator SMI1